MNELPHDSNLDINCLASIFRSRSTSYKFLLFRSILCSIKEKKETLEFSDLALRSLSYASFSINFYKLNFGLSDQISYWVKELSSITEVEHFKTEEIYKKLKYALFESESNNSKIVKGFVSNFKKDVPYRLISPWFKKELEGEDETKKNSLISEFSQNKSKKSLYQIIESEGELKLILYAEWADYIEKNITFIEGWWRSEFLLYLQKNNPTVLSLATKLEPPNERNMAEAKRLYQEFFTFTKTKPICFYSNDPLETISHDHFLPWSFLGNDPIYNFVPTTKSINSKKNNSIPHKNYLRPFSEYQFQFYDFIRNHVKKSRTLEAYLIDLQIDRGINKAEFSKKIISYYEPLYLTSKNQGFHQDWEYKK